MKMNGLLAMTASSQVAGSAATVYGSVALRQASRVPAAQGFLLADGGSQLVDLDSVASSSELSLAALMAAYSGRNCTSPPWRLRNTFGARFVFVCRHHDAGHARPCSVGGGWGCAHAWGSSHRHGHVCPTHIHRHHRSTREHNSNLVCCVHALLLVCYVPHCSAVQGSTPDVSNPQRRACAVPGLVLCGLLHFPIHQRKFSCFVSPRAAFRLDSILAQTLRATCMERASCQLFAVMICPAGAKRT